MADDDALRDAAQAIYDCIRAKGLDTQVGQSQVRHLAEALAVPHHCVSDVPQEEVAVT